MTRRRMPRVALIALAVSGVVTTWAPAASAAVPGGTRTGSGSAVAATADGPAPNVTADNLVWTVKPTDNAIGAGRPNFGYRADPGATVRDSLDVTNRGGEALTLKVYAADAFTPQGGGIDLLRSDQKSVDAGTWITLSSDAITVQPQQTVTVPFTLTVPSTATPGDHSGGIVTTLVTGSGQFAVERRLGSRVQIRVSGALAPKLDLSGVSVSYGTQLNPFSSSSARVTYTVANTGNVRLNAHSMITVDGPLGMLGRTVATEDLGELLPGNARHFEVKVPAAWAFFYLSATVRLEPFPSNPNDSAAQFDLATVSASGATFALNWGHVILLFVAVVGVGGGLRWRKRRRARVKTAIDEAVEKALAGVTPAGGQGQPVTAVTARTALGDGSTPRPTHRRPRGDRGHNGG